MIFETRSEVIYNDKTKNNFEKEGKSWQGLIDYIRYTLAQVEDYPHSGLKFDVKLENQF